MRTGLATVLLAVAGGCGGGKGSVVVTPAAASAATQEEPATAAFDPLAVARASTRVVGNLEASVPPQCYATTADGANPCWVCHTGPRFPNVQDDAALQEEYAFSDYASTSRWTNLFADRSAAVAAISDDEILAWIREDNYTPLRTAIASRADATFFVPDLDLSLGFSVDGYARDGSRWRAFRYKPFPGVFWPTAGSVGDAMIRLPEVFGQDVDGVTSDVVARANYAVLEAALGSDPAVDVRALAWPCEAIEEAALGHDLDGDGRLATATSLQGLPSHYFGAAARVPVRRGLYPEGTELLHTVRYVDPDEPTLFSARLKEVRYARKVDALDDWAILAAYRNEHEEKDEGKPPRPAGTALSGLRNALGWQLQAYIEDAEGRLRLQTDEEHRACMGCHGAIGITVDTTFAFPRKLPGAQGWGHQDLRGMPDTPMLGHDHGEVATYLERARGSGDFRPRDELFERAFRDGQFDRAAIADLDLATLLAPSRRGALDRDKAYLVIVREQSFLAGRDATIAPVAHAHSRIETVSTGLREAGRTFVDASLRLQR